MSFHVHFLIYAITIFHLIHYGNSLQSIKILRRCHSQHIQIRSIDSYTVLKSSEGDEIKSLPPSSNSSTPSLIASKKSVAVPKDPPNVKIISDDERELQIATLIG